MPLAENAVILFQGDSITDCGRARDNERANHVHALGRGYAGTIAGYLLCDHPAAGWQFHNRGISGHRVTDLYARWRKDCIHLCPALVSILVGINDVGHGLGRDDGVEPERFATIYRLLLTYTRECLPTVQFVLCEPFALLTGNVDERWLPLVEQRQAIVRELATEFDATLVPFGTMFAQALERAPAAFWADDGVHPTPAGHELMARTWLAHTIGLFT
ncbi:MAG: SGNH/GDSL hydrolase family protein [Planctomycetota bacterium]